MNENVENIILERLRRMDDKLDRIDGQVRECRDRLGHLEQSYATLSRRVDRIDDRLDRIERRLDLQDAG
jgi:hypothetical protein